MVILLIMVGEMCELGQQAWDFLNLECVKFKWICSSKSTNVLID